MAGLLSSGSRADLRLRALPGGLRHSPLDPEAKALSPVTGRFHGGFLKWGYTQKWMVYGWLFYGEYMVNTWLIVGFHSQGSQ